MTDVIVIGGGVIGLSIAYELAGRGVSVTVLDQGQIGREASWAGAGMLPPGNPQTARSTEARWRGESHVLWSPLSRQLLQQTGIDNGYRRSGGLEIRLAGASDQFDAEIDSWRSEGVEVQQLSADDVRTLEPRLSDQITCAYRLPEMAQVRNPRHLKAIQAGCVARDVKLQAGISVQGFDREGEKIIGVQTGSETLHAGQFVVAAGCWSQRLLAQAGCHAPVQPVRGQMVLLQTQSLPIGHIVQIGSRYLVPRTDGRLLVGSTEEFVGFDKQNTAGGIGGLMTFAVQLLPDLAQEPFERAWAGLRPKSADGLPYLGRVPDCENLYVATGHFRSGLQLAPITAVVTARLMLGEDPQLPLEALACDRYAHNVER